MANWSDLKASVAEVIKTNGNQEITGQILQNTLNSIISNLGENATFAGIATPTTNPGTPDGNVFYLAGEGTYANFDGITVSEDEGIVILWNGEAGVWQKLVPNIASQQDSSYLMKIAKTDNAFSNFPLMTISYGVTATEYSYQNYRSSQFIKVTPGERFWVYLFCGKAPSVIFYNLKSSADLYNQPYADLNPDNFEYVSRIEPTDTTSPVIGIITIPDNVTYVRFQSLVGIDLPLTNYFNGSKAFYMYEKNPIIYDLMTNAAFSNFPITTIYFGNKETYYQNFRSSPFIQVSEGDRFWVYLDAGSASPVLYYNLKSGVSRDNVPYADMDPAYYDLVSSEPEGKKTGEITIPAGVSFVRFQSIMGKRLEDEYPNDIKGGQAFYVYAGNPLVSAVENLQNDMAVRPVNYSFSQFPLKTIYFNGSEDEYQNYVSSPFMKVEELDTFFVDLFCGTAPSVVFYNAKEDADFTEPYADLNPDNYQYVSSLYANEAYSGVVVVPSGVDFVRFQTIVGVDEKKGYGGHKIEAGKSYYIYGNSDLGKMLIERYPKSIKVGALGTVNKILFFGDSITYGVISGNVTDYKGQSIKWSTRLSTMLGATEVNKGVGGIELTSDNFYNVINQTTETDVDLIFVEAGINDCTRATVPMGTTTDTSTAATVHGKIKRVIQLINSKWPNVRIIFVGVYDAAKQYQVIYTVDQFNYALYQEAMLGKCGFVNKKDLGFPTNEDDPLFLTYLADKLHPTGLGSDIYASAIYNFLK